MSFMLKPLLGSNNLVLKTSIYNFSYPRFENMHQTNHHRRRSSWFENPTPISVDWGCFDVVGAAFNEPDVVDVFEAAVAAVVVVIVAVAVAAPVTVVAVVVVVAGVVEARLVSGRFLAQQRERRKPFQGDHQETGASHSRWNLLPVYYGASCP